MPTVSTQPVLVSRGTVEAYSGPQLAAALADSAVRLVLIPVSFSMTGEEWAPYPTPVLLDRNVSIAGSFDSPSAWPVLDLGFVTGKVQLDFGVALTFTRLVITRWRAGPHFQAIGFDLLASSAPRTGGGAWPILEVYNAAWIQRTCLPNNFLRNTSASTVPRHPLWPDGKQITIPSLSQPGCVPSADAPPLQRCWPAIGLYVDIATYGYNFDAYGNPTQSNVALRSLNLTYLCEVVMTEECVSRFQAVGCFYSIFPAQTGARAFPTAVPPTASNTSLASGGRGGADGHLLTVRIAVASCVIGGLLLCGALIAAALVARRRAASRRQSRGDAGGAPAASWPSFPRLGSEANACGFVGISLDGPEPEPRAQAPPPPDAVPWGNMGGAAAAAPSPKAVLSSPHPRDPPCRNMLSTAGGTLSQFLRSSPPGAEHSHATGADGADAGPLRSAQMAHPLSATGEHLFVNPQSPLLPSIPLDVRLGSGPGEVQLLPVTRGKGAGGRVVEGVYGGALVAVKLVAATWEARPANAGLHGPWQRVPDAAQVLGALPAAGAAAPDRSVAERGGMLPASLLEHAGAPPDWQAHGGGSQASPQRQGLGGGEAGAAPRVIAAAVPRPQGQPTAAAPGGSQAPEGTAAAGGAGGAGADGSAGPASDGSGSEAGDSDGELSRTDLEMVLAQEVEVLGRCCHPNVVRLLAANLRPPTLCLVMELMDTSLDRLLYGAGPSAPPLSLHMVLHIAIQIAQALAYLHPTVMHRDLKPGNVLISRPESSFPVVKLADFGLSRLLLTVLVTDNPEVGTAAYIAPECFDLGNPSTSDRVDIYAFGVILWEMLAGRRPWDEMSTVQVAFAVSVRAERLPLDALSPERCPPKLRSLIADCWDAVPERRPAAQEVLKRLALVQQQVQRAEPAATMQCFG